MKQQFDQSSKPVAVGEVRRDWVVYASKDLANKLLDALSSEGQMQRAKFVHNAAESKQVAPGVVRRATPYFRSGVAEGSADGLRLDVVFRSEIP